jgi:hypothetical protein
VLTASMLLTRQLMGGVYIGVDAPPNVLRQIWVPAFHCPQREQIQAQAIANGLLHFQVYRPVHPYSE